MARRQTSPRGERFRIRETVHVADLGHEDGGDRASDTGDGLDGLIALVVTQLLMDAPFQHHHLTVVVHDGVA
jgi:hypothetical protein